MEEVQINFKNKSNPKSGFDLIKLQQLFINKHLDHNPEELHRVTFFILFLITEGSGTHTIDFINYNYEKGSLFTIRKDQLHKFTKNNFANGSLILFTEEFLIQYLEKTEFQKAIQLFNDLLLVPKLQLKSQDYQTILEIISRIEHEYFNTHDEHSQSIIRSELHILITKIYRIKSKRKPIIQDQKYISEFLRFQTLVENNVTNTIRVKDYANMMLFSTKTLNKITREVLNKSAKEFIDDIAIMQIKRLLINTALSIKEIAYNTGFEETTNFYKYFKRHVGITPEQFRQKY